MTITYDPAIDEYVVSGVGPTDIGLAQTTPTLARIRRYQGSPAYLLTRIDTPTGDGQILFFGGDGLGLNGGEGGAILSRLNTPTTITATAATYTGAYRSVMHSDADGASFGTSNGSASLSADFAAETVTGTITGRTLGIFQLSDVTLNLGQIDQTVFSGTTSGGWDTTNTFNTPPSPAPTLTDLNATGTYEGLFVSADGGEAIGAVVIKADIPVGAITEIGVFELAD